MYFLIFQSDWLTADQLHRFTVVFNAFVCMQLFNQINARKINDEAALLNGLLDNRLFLTIWSTECLLQVRSHTFSHSIASDNDRIHVPFSF